MFATHPAAAAAIADLNTKGYMAEFARLTENEKCVFASTSKSIECCNSVWVVCLACCSLGIPFQTAREDLTNIYFSSLPSSMTEDELVTLVTQYGAVVSARVLKDTEGSCRCGSWHQWCFDRGRCLIAGNSRGIGFVRMNTEAACSAAIDALDGLTLAGIS
jgi:RNA recognition motif-containing protein